MIHDLIERQETQEPTKGPAKRWRNWWRVNVPAIDQHGEKNNPGDVVCGPAYPSRDVAESIAVKWLKLNPPHVADWLGAFPEGERP